MCFSSLLRHLMSTADHDDSDELAFQRESSLNASPMQHHRNRPPSKPNGGTRLLALVLQALVMATALFLFFLFAGIAAIVLVHLFVAGRSLRHHRRQDRHHRACEIGQGLSREELKSMGCARYASRGRHAAAMAWGRDCAVCLEGFRDGDRYRVMPKCGHAFHKGCVDRWLAKARMCPTCRTEVVGGGGR